MWWSFQCRMFPPTMKQLVMISWRKIKVLIIAITSASLSVLPDFSPSAFAHILQIFLIRMLLSCSAYGQEDKDPSLLLPSCICEGVVRLLVSS